MYIKNIEQVLGCRCVYMYVNPIHWNVVTDVWIDNDVERQFFGTLVVWIANILAL